MVKTGAFKKIAALTAAIAMVGSFAVCASAEVTVTSTTAYTNGTENVTVTATVSGLDASEVAPVQVTYYATNADAAATDGVVFIDQTTATAASVTFPAFTTKAAYLKSDVKVGYTNGTAVSGEFDGHSITCNGTEVLFVPTTNEGGTFQIPFEMPQGHELKSVTGAGVTGTPTYANGNISVIFGSPITGDVALTVATQPEVQYTGSYIDSGAVAMTEGPEAGYRKITVLGQVDGATEFGILVSESAITAASDLDALPADADAYAAKGANQAGYFAVQLIDTAAAEGATFIEAGTQYYTAVYYKNKAGKYVVVSGETVSAQ